MVISFVLWTHVTHPLNIIFPLFISSPCVARQVVVRRKSGSTEHQRSCNRRELISTGRQTHEVRIKRMSSAQPVGTFSVRRPFQLLCMLKTCHRIDPTSPDEERISPHVTRRQAYKQRMRTDTNGSKIGVYVSRPLVLSGKVWHPFYIGPSSYCFNDQESESWFVFPRLTSIVPRPLHTLNHNVSSHNWKVHQG